MKLSIAFTALLASLVSTGHCKLGPPTVPTTSGKIHGIFSSPSVFAYFAIPYAVPPIGPLRFKAPVPLDTPTENRPAARKFGPACWERDITPMPGFPTFEHSEDCLQLNVWRSKSSDKKLKPVIIWIHGGSWNIGTAAQDMTDFTRFAEAHPDIVYVSFNYRLNFWGYANSPTLKPEDSNAGMRDQRLAIEWVKKNIVGFGGDPNHIVIYGQSAGAGSVHTHLFTDTKKPLVKGAILSSGTVGIAGSNTQEISRNTYDKVAEAAGCTGSTEEVFACLQELPAEELVPAIKSGTGGSGTVPFVDNQLIFPFKEYVRKAAAGEFAKVPLLTGTNDNEADAFFFDGSTNTVNYEMSDWFTLANFQCFDSYFAKTHAQANAPTYRYRYSGLFPFMSQAPNRVAHSFELPVVMGSASFVGIPQDEEAKKATVVMQNIWASFIKDPANGLKKNFSWPEYNPAKKTLGRLFEDNDFVNPIHFVNPLKGEETCEQYVTGPDPGIPF